VKFHLPAAVVPAPPWCTTALTFGKIHSCGILSKVNTLLKPSNSLIPPHPLAITALLIFNQIQGEIFFYEKSLENFVRNLVSKKNEIDNVTLKLNLEKTKDLSYSCILFVINVEINLTN
jgi:hypothetical protein